MESNLMEPTNRREARALARAFQSSGVAFTSEQRESLARMLTRHGWKFVRHRDRDDEMRTTRDADGRWDLWSFPGGVHDRGESFWFAVLITARRLGGHSGKGLRTIAPFPVEHPPFQHERKMAMTPAEVDEYVGRYVRYVWGKGDGYASHRQTASARLRDWFARGLTPVPHGQAWHGRLIGKRGPYYGHGDVHEIMRTELGAIDHPSLWRWGKQPWAFVSQPYDDHEGIKDAPARWQRYADENGLTFVHDANLSWHNPGMTDLFALFVKMPDMVSAEVQAKAPGAEVVG